MTNQPVRDALLIDLNVNWLISQGKKVAKVDNIYRKLHRILRLMC